MINKRGADKAARIFRLWADLFAEGPDILTLTGAFKWHEDDPSEGNYSRVEANREDLVASLRIIAEYLAKATTGDFYVLHFGV